MPFTEQPESRGGRGDRRSEDGWKMKFWSQRHSGVPGGNLLEVDRQKETKSHPAGIVNNHSQYLSQTISASQTRFTFFQKRIKRRFLKKGLDFK